MTRAGFAAFGLVLLVAGCGAGKYGFSPKYVPTDGEDSAIDGAREYDPVMYGREPDQWRKGKTMLFGVVTSRTAGQGGAAYVTLSIRRLEPRNLCTSGNDEDSCRVTVSDKDFGTMHVSVGLHGEDDVGEHSVGTGSLLRVVGQIGQDVDPGDGQPVLRASFYRHWPRHFYVTKADADQMRQ